MVLEIIYIYIENCDCSGRIASVTTVSCCSLLALAVILEVDPSNRLVERLVILDARIVSVCLLKQILLEGFETTGPGPRVSLLEAGFQDGNADIFIVFGFVFIF